MALLAMAYAQATCGGLDEADARRVAQVQRVLRLHGADVWPGWGEPLPWLLRSGDCEYLIGHPAPPPGFAPVDRDPAEAPLVWVMVGHLTPGPVATTWPVAGVWSIALPTLDEFQLAIDTQLGPGVVTLDDDSYVRAALHEAFHAFQLTSLGGLDGVPRFGLRDEGAALHEVVRDTGHDAWVTAQAHQLARALRAATLEEVTAAVHAFLDQRAHGRSVYGDQVAALGLALEWLEGSARYADTRIVALAEGAGGGSPGVTDTLDQRALADILAQLDGLPQSLSVRDTYAALGAAQGFVLDRLAPGWQRQVLAGRESLEALLRGAVTP